MTAEPQARAVLKGLAHLGGGIRSIEELAQVASLPVREVTALLCGSDRTSGLEASDLVSIRRTRGGGLEVALTERGLEVAGP